MQGHGQSVERGGGENRGDGFSGGYVVENEYDRTEMNGETSGGPLER